MCISIFPVSSTFTDNSVHGMMWQKILRNGFMVLLLAGPLFIHLGRAPVTAWDEALFAMRAAYIVEEGRYLPDYDHWIPKGALHPNSKPPFTTWIQAAFFKIFGIDEWVLRLPTALAALGTVLFFLWFFHRKMGVPQVGWASAFVLVTSLGYVREHAARSGDQDVPLALYMLTGVLAFYLLLRSDDKKEQNKWWAVLTLSSIAAILTKYLFGALFVPGMVLYAAYKKKLPWLLRQRALWVALAAVLLVCGGWVAIMEVQRPGFAERVIFYEMLNRYATTIEDHHAPWYFFLTQFWSGHFQPWLWLLPVPVAMLFLPGDRRWKDLVALLLTCALIHLLVISTAKTKLPHYDVVMYPLLAVLAGVGLWHAVTLLREAWRRPAMRATVLGLGLSGGVIFGVAPYSTLMKKVWNPTLTEDEHKYGYLFRELEAHHGGLKSFKLVAPVFEAQAVYYAGLFNRKKGYHIELEDFPKRVQVGDTIMVCNRQFIDYLFNTYHLQGLVTYDQCFVARVEGRLDHEQ